MSDVSAVLLSLGEAGTAGARQHLEAQTLPFFAIHLVENVCPFARAFQAGLQRVETDFFLQCDSDMWLQPNCLERLYAAIDASTALVLAQLEDPLQGPLYGVKLFRTRACREAEILAEPNCEIRHADRLRQNGWSVHSLPEVLGSHQQIPGGEAYQFERFRILGCKAVARAGWWDATYRLQQLSRRLHQTHAPAAAAGLLAGLTLSSAEQVHDRPVDSPEYTGWKAPSSPDLEPVQPRIPYFEHGWRHGYEQRRSHGRRPRHSWLQFYLRSNSPADWLFVAGYVAACLDPEERPAAELWPRLQGWEPALTRDLK